MSRKLLTKFVNRNPRNLEMMGLQAPPTGYDLEVDRQRRSFIYKANLVRSKAHTEAQLIHYRDGLVLSASTREKSISSQLYSNVDASAAANLGTVLALRCLMSGIHFAIPAHSDEDIQRSLHLKAFYDCLVNGGVTLGEPPHIEHTYRNDRSLVYDSYEVHHTREDKTDE
uniref:Large ribosomal subunit protein uL18m n=1 Tax=Ascaris suum TaxID=6253 RepID=F1LE54_ASCSU